MILRDIIKQIRTFLFRKYYIVGFVDKSNISYDDINIANNVHWIKFSGYKINWIADPFILSVNNDSIIILAEQWVESNKRGRIVRLKVSRKNYKIIDFTIVLEGTTHLSFPIIFKEKGNLYVYPENYESGDSYIYQYNHEKNILENPQLLINEPLLDSQIIKIDSTYYLFAIRFEGKPDENKCLYIYKSASFTGPYNLMQTIANDRNTERGAGSIIKINGRYIRPTQNCDESYGKSVIFKELVLKNNKFQEREIGSYLPNKPYLEGLHTYNELDNLCVIDSIAYNHGNLMRALKRLIKFILNINNNIRYKSNSK